MNKERSIVSLPLDGGVLCFDFINTVHSWREDNRHEYLGNYAEWIQWCQKLKLLSAKRRKILLDYAQNHSAETFKAFDHIIRARKMLYHFFSAVAAGQLRKLDNDLLEKFNQQVTASLKHIAFRVNNNTIELGWRQQEIDLLEPFYLVMKSAYDLLTTAALSRIKECPVCGWIMMDFTKNNQRRWCSPQTCGSIEKSRKYYLKKKAAAGKS